MLRINKELKMTKKEKMLWMIELLDSLSDMHIYIDEIAEEDGVDVSYKDVREIIEDMKKLVEENL